MLLHLPLTSNRPIEMWWLVWSPVLALQPGAYTIVVRSRAGATQQFDFQP